MATNFADATARETYDIQPGEVGLVFIQNDVDALYRAMRQGVGAENWQEIGQVDTAADADIAAVAADVATLQTQVVQKASLTVLYTDLTDADGAQSFDFDDALPADALVLGASIDVAVGFTDGAGGVFTADLGVKGGDTDSLIDGADLAAVARVGSPEGVKPSGWYMGSTIAIDVKADVDVKDATAGALTAEVYYVRVSTL